MDVGLALPQFDFSIPGERPLQWRTTVEYAQRAERLGFGSVWLPGHLFFFLGPQWAERLGFGSVWLADHLFFDVAKYGGPDEQFACYDPLAGLAALARETS